MNSIRKKIKKLKIYLDNKRKIVFINLFLFLTTISTPTYAKIKFDDSQLGGLKSYLDKVLGFIWSIAVVISVAYFFYSIVKLAIAYQTGSAQEQEHAMSRFKKSVLGFVGVLFASFLYYSLYDTTGGFKPF